MPVIGMLRQNLQNICICLLLPGFLHAQSFDEAKALYYKGVDGDKVATRLSTDMLGKLAAASPDNAVIAAYLSSNKLLESSRTFALWNKNRLAREGIVGLDRAVSIAPDSLEVRFVRAASTYNLPGFFNRQQQTEADFAFLASRVGDAAANGTLEKRLAAAALYYHGLIVEKKGNRRAALDWWKTAAALSPDTKAGQAAAAKLR